MRRENQYDDPLNQYRNTYLQSKSSLFPEIRPRRVQGSGYTLVNREHTMGQSVRKHPQTRDNDTIDESVVISESNPNFYGQYDTKPYANTPSSYRYDREHVRLPHIARPRPQHVPHEYLYDQPDYNHSNYLHHPQSVQYRYRSLNHYRHRYDRDGETYDPRWWYMPINSVHGPRSRQWANHHHHHPHYTPPKWYQLPDRR